ncbi:hypothetical protein [Nocardia sp. NPDC049149]|uniref:hypothetical protein n=1 Tax=Nocardia sp. NPDC049149 TaxID=3364315 RepID=UPI0037100DC5
MIVTNWTGVEVRALWRVALRVTQEEFAERLGYQPVTIRKWQQATAARPVRGKSAHDLDTQLAALNEDQTQRFWTAVAESRPQESWYRRPSEGIETGYVLPVASEPVVTIDMAAVGRLRTRIRAVDDNYSYEPSTSLLAEAGRCLGQIEILRAAAMPELVRRELLAAEAEGSTCMSRLVWDASQRRDNVNANHYLGQAVDAARQLNDRVAEGRALLRQSYVALYGQKDPVVGLAITTQTVETASRSSKALAGVAMLHQAEAHAMLGQLTECERALSTADTYLDRIEPDEPARTLFSPTQRGQLAGSCYLFLGKAKRAQEILEGVAEEARNKTKAEAIILGNLSLAYVRQGDIDGCIDALNRAIDVVENTRGGGGLNIVFDACRELRPSRDMAPVQEVYDRVLTLMATS